MQIRICDKCKKTNINSLLPKLKKIKPDAEIIIGCQGFCGIGMTKSFAIVDNIPIITETEEELIEKIKEL